MPFLATFVLLFALGFLGILSLIAVVEQVRALPGATEIHPGALVFLVLLQPSLFLAAAVATGVALGEKVGLVSLIVRRARRQPLPAGTTAGLLRVLALTVIIAATVALADLLVRLAWPQSFLGVPRVDQANLAGRVMALLYGGIVEELLLRFGLMTLLVWLGSRLLQGRRPPALIWAAIIIQALIFGASHLPALVSAAPPDAPLVLRTILLNSVLGILFGWVYWRRSLEHAMLAHGATHVVFWIATPVFVALLS